MNQEKVQEDVAEILDEEEVLRRIEQNKKAAEELLRNKDKMDRFLERLEKKLESAPGQLARAGVDLAKDWRMDKYLRNLEAMLIVTDGTALYVITGAGDVLEPEHDVAAIGSGGNFALAAARGLMQTDLDAEAIARKAMAIAADICVYTNGNLTVERIKAQA